MLLEDSVHGLRVFHLQSEILVVVLDVLEGAGQALEIVETHIGMARFPNVAVGQAHSIKLLSKHLGPVHGASGQL